MWFKVLVLCFALFHDTNAKCTVIDSKTKERADCVFPFTLSTDPEKVYTNCTNFLKGERFWCSTKVRYILKRLCLNRVTLLKCGILVFMVKN